MKALTIKQPWAGAIVHQTKRVENRTWKLPARMHGARILIHAGAQRDRWATVYGPHLDVYGAIVGAATLTGCHFALDRDICCSEWAFPNTYHWELADVTALTTPIPCNGRLGFWSVDEEIAVAVGQAEGSAS
ncbi:hypothetical protein [Streptomyces sp. NPDC051994]|uniref:hypothetical protein n=1 Tax=unclassified Streptomyces TaxID=2593676 RepID=UPI003443D826